MNRLIIVAATLVCMLGASAEVACQSPSPTPNPQTKPVAPKPVAAHADAAGAAVGSQTESQVVGKAFEGAELLALAGDQLLLWSVQGRASVRSATGQWSDLELPLAGIMDVRAKGTGFLLVGHDRTTRDEAVIWVSAEGQELKRWALPKDAQFGAAFDTAGSQLMTRSGVLGLQPDGTLSPPRPLPEDVHRPSYTSLRWVELAGASILCHGADLSMANSAPGHCRRLEPAGWEFEAPFVQTPLECGPWLILSNSADGKTLQVRAESTGQPQSSIKLSSLPLRACVSPSELLLGTKEIEIRRLPSLDVAWHYPVGKNPVRQLAATETFVAYVVSGSFDVRLIRKPEPAGH